MKVKYVITSTVQIFKKIMNIITLSNRQHLKFKILHIKSHNK